MIANCITVGRILFSLCLFLLSPSSVPFAVLYLLCGATDVLDGFVARKLHTESEKGANLDSIADLVFAVAYALKILPFLHLPLWLWVWVAGIAVIKAAGIFRQSKKERKFFIRHSFANRLTGTLLFFLPLSVPFIKEPYGAILVCAAASFAAIAEWKEA